MLAREKLPRLRGVAGQCQADHPGFRRLCLQALAFRTIPGNGDFNRHRRFEAGGAQCCQRSDEHIVALCGMQAAEAAQPQRLSGCPWPGFGHFGIGEVYRPGFQPLRSHAKAVLGQRGDRTGIGDP